MHRPPRTVSAWLISGLLITAAALPAAATGDSGISARGSKLDTASAPPQPTDFWQAVNAGSLAHVKRFAPALDINARDALGQPALMIAAGRGYGDVVAWLLTHGADANITGPRNWTPLIAATSANHNSVVRQLLAHKADVRVHSSDGFNALFYAIEYQFADVARTLLDGGADANARLPAAIAQGHTALMHAAQRNAPQLATLLLQKGARVDAIDSQGRTALFYAAQHDAVAVLDVLKRHRANIRHQDHHGDTALHAIAVRSDDAVVSWLLANGMPAATRNQAGETALTLAAFHGNTALTLQLLPPADAAQKTAALFAAVRGGVLPTVTALLDAGIDINTRNTHGETPLMLAAQQRHAHIVEQFLQRKADIGALDRAGNSALLHALQVTPTHAGVVQQLLAAGSDPQQANVRGQTAQALLEHSDNAELRALLQPGDQLR